MIRKLLVIAAAIAMPVSAVTVIGGSSIAGAGTPLPPDPAVNCAVSSTVTFAPPGISVNGVVTTSKTSTTTTSGTSVVGPCTGTGGPPLNITSKNLKCGKVADTPVPGCVKGSTYFNSWSGFIAQGTTAVAKDTKKLTINVNGITYSIKGTGATVAATCGSEVGYTITGAVKAPKNDKGQTVNLTACLGAVTGTGLSSYTNFVLNLNGPGVLATAQIDPATSTLSIT